MQCRVKHSQTLRPWCIWYVRVCVSDMHVSDMGKKGMYAALYNDSYTSNTSISYLSYVNVSFCLNCVHQNILFLHPSNINSMWESSNSTIVYKAIFIHGLLWSLDYYNIILNTQWSKMAMYGHIRVDMCISIHQHLKILLQFLTFPFFAV